MKLDLDSLDFERCDEEPIHRPEAIQGFGYLVALAPDTGRVAIHSANIGELLDLGDRSHFLGEDFFRYLDPQLSDRELVLESFRQAREAGIRLPLSIRIAAAHRAGEGRDLDAMVYASGELLVLEVEPSPPQSNLIRARQQAQLYQRSVGPGLAELGSVAEIARNACQVIRRLTGFERVVVLRFNPDESGTMIAEAKDDDVESFLDFTYPATDIPSQARELYLRSWSRMNPDVARSTVALVPSIAESGRPPLDMSHSVIRAMSPIHAQYMANLELRASLSISLVNDGKLWGLISCHHRQPHYVPQAVRLACESLGRLFVWQLYAREKEDQAARRVRADRAVARLIRGLDEGEGLLDILRGDEKEVLGLMRASSFVYVAGEERFAVGRTPPGALVDVLLDLCNRARVDEPLRVRRLEDLVDHSVDRGGFCGALVVSTAEPHHCTMWLRDEHRRRVRWAGVPQESSPDAPKAARLAPRTSFELHEQEIRSESLAWEDQELESALCFNRLLLRHALDQKIEARRAVERLELRDRIKNDFIATLAHELRNPLSPIQHAVILLQRARQSGQRSRAIAVIERQLEHLVKLLDDLLDVARITRGKISLVRQTHDLLASVADAVEQVSPLIEKKHQNLSCDLPEEPINVLGDSTRLTQILANLLNNASKYTGPGGEIGLRMTAAPDRVVVDVMDHGIGIPPDRLEAVFGLFAQVDPRLPPDGGGLGIGLALARSLVELHGGSLTAHSEGVGKGSCFTLTLPRLSRQVSPHSTAAEKEPERARRLNVLVVDDNWDAADMLAELVESLGHEVQVAHGGEEALQLQPRQRPDVALLDLGLPDMDGIELSRRLRELPAGERTHYVAQTAWGREEDRRRTEQAGFEAHLVKPIDPAGLDSLLRKLGSDDQIRHGTSPPHFSDDR